MNNIQVLNYNNHQIRQIASEDGEILFCAKDVLEALGTKTKLKDIELDDPEESVFDAPILDALGREQIAKFITEPTLYEILGKLHVETAKPFRRWVTHEVLPSIRKHGYYINAQMTEEQFKLMKEKVKELMPYKRKVDHQLSLAADWRDENSGSRLEFINIRSGKKSTLWKLTADVKKFLLTKSKLNRGKLFDDWKIYHNFNEYCRSIMEEEGFEI